MISLSATGEAGRGRGAIFRNARAYRLHFAGITDDEPQAVYCSGSGRESTMESFTTLPSQGPPAKAKRWDGRANILISALTDRTARVKATGTTFYFRHASKRRVECRRVDFRFGSTPHY